VIGVLAVAAEERRRGREDPRLDAPHDLGSNVDEPRVVVRRARRLVFVHARLLLLEERRDLELRVPLVEAGVRVAVCGELEVPGERALVVRPGRGLELGHDIALKNEVEDALEVRPQHFPRHRIDERHEELRLHRRHAQALVGFHVLANERLTHDHARVGALAVLEADLVDELGLPVEEEEPRNLVRRGLPAFHELLVEGLDRPVYRGAEGEVRGLPGHDHLLHVPEGVLARALQEQGDA